MTRAWAYLYDTPEPLSAGLDALAHDLHGFWHRRTQVGRRFARQAQAAHQLAAKYTLASCENLEQAMIQARVDLGRGLARKASPTSAVACVSELVRRSLGLTPHVVQLMGALALHEGLLAEMATGEGKTLTVAMAAVMAAWGRNTCHVITANDYLAERDAENMRAIYTRAGLSVACALEAQSPEERQGIYAADVVYVTAKTLLADYLRDRIAARQVGQPEWTQVRAWLADRPVDSRAFMLPRGLHTAIVDEADNVLVDEAVTPLILSEERDSEGLADAVSWARDLAQRLAPKDHYLLDERNHSLELGVGAKTLGELEAWRLPAHWRASVRREELLRQALVVKHFLTAGKQYVVVEGEVVLLDEFSGRMTPERSLNGGLHQAIEVREGVSVTPMKQSLEQMSFQSFFRRFKHLAGTTGTGFEARHEFWRVYRLAVVRVPTHEARRVREAAPMFFQNDLEKWVAIAEAAATEVEKGRAVLIGVRSVASSQALSEALTRHGVPHAVLNATQAEQEAEIIAEAGVPGRVTVATNMAGRGTDIHLDQGVREAGGLHVIIGECNESARIDRQLAGRCGRQGDPGSVQVMVSKEDPLLRRYAARGGWRTGVRGVVRRAQRLAEGDAFQRRLGVLRQDEWLRSALPFDGVRA
ncbi:MAG: hypothetical protein RLZZ174_701 [Pseudomonadota bacterium]|jgi:preprotein translocase subunit SecA